MSYEKGARTAFANKAFVLSEMFNAKFRNTQFSGAVTRIVKVFPPETESTGGGKMARESIALVPENDDQTGASIVCGWLDIGQNSAELRSFSMLADRHRERFGDLPFDLNREEYEAFLEQARAFLADEGIALAQLGEPSASSTAAGVKPSGAPGVQVMRATPSNRAMGSSATDSGPGVGALVAGAIFLGVLIGMVVMLILR